MERLRKIRRKFWYFFRSGEKKEKDRKFWKALFRKSAKEEQLERLRDNLKFAKERITYFEELVKQDFPYAEAYRQIQEAKTAKAFLEKEIRRVENEVSKKREV